MKLSRESDYGLRGLVALARRPPDKATMLAEIAVGEGLPYSFLSKIFQKLAQHRIVTAHRGAQRGYTLARQPGAISVREVLEAIEGPDLADRCLVWDRECSPARRCLLHAELAAAARVLLACLERTTLADLSAASNPPGRAYPIAKGVRGAHRSAQAVRTKPS
jgi:Rrf2 family protein